MIFDSFSTEEDYDVLKVYDGTSMNSLPLLGEFSGTTIPGVLIAKSGSVFVRFTSDGGGSEDGVGMRWSDIGPASTSSPTFTGGTPSHAKPSEDAFMLWRACITTGVLICAGFALGTQGSKNCPANYFRIVAEDVCRSAAAAVGQAYQGRETKNGSPRGCNLNEGGVFLNDATVFIDAISAEWKLLCSGAPLRYSRRRGPYLQAYKGAAWVQRLSLGMLKEGAIEGRSGAAVCYRPGPLWYSRVVADLLTPSSALPSRIGFLYAATASPTPSPTGPGDTTPPTASPTPSPTYSPDGTSALHPVRSVGHPRSACRTPHGL